MNDTREHIIKTSLKLFLQKNCKEVTMKEIVDATELSKEAFYHYFESKEKVFEEVTRFYNNFLIFDYSGFSKISLKQQIIAMQQNNQSMNVVSNGKTGFELKNAIPNVHKLYLSR